MKSEMKKEKVEFLGDRRKPQVKTIIPHQTGTSNKARDKVRKALPAGKRISKFGKTYYEYRKNRSDLVGEML